MTKRPINLSDLLRQRTVKGERIEYKTSWNPDAIIRTLCAYVNDFENLGGGYVVIGQDCDLNGQPVFPPVGLQDNQLDQIQRELLAHCQLIQPPYFPVMSVEAVEGRKLIVLWAPGVGAGSIFQLKQGASLPGDMAQPREGLPRSGIGAERLWIASLYPPYRTALGFAK